MDNLILYDGAYNGPQIDAALSRALAGGAIDQQIGALQAAVGSPLEAATVAEMTNVNKVYVYTGTEAGYTAGHWYYWNGSAWTDGGVYNAVAVDMTLSDSSDNAVANRIIKAALDALQASADAVAELALASFPHATASGSVVSFSDGAAVPLKGLSATAATGRESAPVTIRIYGKNFVNPANFYNATVDASGNYSFASAGANVCLQTGQNGSGYVINPANFGKMVHLPAGTFTYSYKPVSGNQFTRVYAVDPETGVRTQLVAATQDGDYFSGTFTLAEPTMVCMVKPSSGSTTFAEMMIELGSTRTSYEDYHGATYVFASAADVSPDGISTYYGQNTVFSDNGDVSVGYRADTTLYIETRLPSTLGAPLLFSPVPVLTDEAEPDAEPDAEQEAESDE